MSFELWNRVIQSWRDEDIPIRAGVTAQEIATFESRYKVTLPCDVREYFTSVDGTGDHMTAESLHRFWPLSEVIPADDYLRLYNHKHRDTMPDFFIFADHSICINVCAVKLNLDPMQPAPVIGIFSDGAPKWDIAASFREFMTKFLIDPWSVL
jgi:hypothetical protein